MKAVRFSALATGLLFLLPGLARAAAPPVTVTKLDDSGPGSLRQAIADAAAGSTISFSVTGTITLTSGELTIARDLDIEGPGSDKLTVSGNNTSRVFDVQSGTVTLAGMTITNGLANGSSPDPASAGGGVMNAATLTLSHDVLSANQALGDPSQSLLDVLGLGGGAGGGVFNSGTLQVSACQFTGNLARGGDASSGGGLDGGAAGGGIFNYQGSLTVNGSTFSANQAIGGNGCVSSFLSGHAYGGAITSQNGALVVRGSRFSLNQAIGGNGNQVTSPQPLGTGPNTASSGAIEVTLGATGGTISDCTVEHNQAIGGTGSSGGDGGDAGGGGILVADTGVTISNCAIHDNLALGGAGGPGGSGGVAWGGGLTSSFGVTLTVNGSSVQHNLALGGAGGPGANGGNGLGGGLYGAPASSTYNLPASSITLAGATVSDNLALGGAAGTRGSAGQGVGGGVYRLGTFSYDTTTVIEMNLASTSDNDLGPASLQ